MPKKVGVTTVDAPKSRKKIKPNVIIQGDVVRVWSEVGVTLAVTFDPPQFLRLTFGHERIAKNSTMAEIRRTAKLVDEFNETELERQIRKYRRLVRRESAVDDDKDGPSDRIARRRGR